MSFFDQICLSKQKAVHTGSITEAYQQKGHLLFIKLAERRSRSSSGAQAAVKPLRIYIEEKIHIKATKNPHQQGYHAAVPFRFGSRYQKPDQPLYRRKCGGTPLSSSFYFIVMVRHLHFHESIVKAVFSL